MNGAQGDIADALICMVLFAMLLVVVLGRQPKSKSEDARSGVTPPSGRVRGPGAPSGQPLPGPRTSNPMFWVGHGGSVQRWK